jgi:hypothetical protein
MKNQKGLLRLCLCLEYLTEGTKDMGNAAAFLCLDGVNVREGKIKTQKIVNTAVLFVFRMKDIV